MDCRVCFYKGVGLAALAVRLDTRRPGQPLSRVPAHVAVVIDGMLYQFISTGWQSRPATSSDYAWSVPVTLPNGAAALAFAESCRGERYDWLTIALVLLSRFVPDRWLKFSRRRQKRVCSWFVKAALEHGGWDCPHWLRAQYDPETPNDLTFATANPL